jgi:hypothetical protein
MNMLMNRPIDQRCRLSATLEYENGEFYEWRSPEWSKLSLWEKKRLFRIQEYVDAIRSMDNWALHFPIVKFIAQTTQIESQDDDGNVKMMYPKRVVLAGHHTLIRPPPKDYDTKIHPGFHSLLGNKVKDTVGKEVTKEVYWWTVPKDYDFKIKEGQISQVTWATLTKVSSPENTSS